MPEFKYAYLCQSSKGWQQIALVMSDGSTIFVETYEKHDPAVSYILSAEGDIITL